ncbi:hypothetical protein GCM10010123_12730 [Pilimelia anulata]|uniref:Uncharacterized protein n=1 Tax=Pilimelia anulata TaxID=53371 RepID=A0A8J3B0P5_9ACTN|nr:hypothetical protein [Pilimelia anulata]GGJ84522.1 hypothetical protein GCM10010123_12730 [Pilimelia anulata]
MSKAMSESEFLEFADGQIAIIDGFLAEHGPAGGFCCSCGQLQPCPQRGMLELRRRHYERWIASTRAARRALSSDADR